MPKRKIKIVNPYNKLDKHYCFGCSDRNPIGLHLEFEVVGDTVQSRWSPSETYQGFHNVLHGGIIATLLDEVGAWAIQLLYKTAGVTGEMQVKYLRPVSTSGSELLIVAKILEERKRLVDISVELINHEQVVCASAKITYFTYPESIAREKLFYPGIGAFMPKDLELE